MKVLITGAKGQLGQDLQKVFAGEEITAFDLDLDITDIEALRGEFQNSKPDLVINSAAYTNVDGCEENQELAFKVNAIGPANLAIAANEIGARLVHISTDYVFDGQKKEPYKETDNVNPQSVYGKTKLAGELAVEALIKTHYITRTAWLYGAGGPNFVKTIQKIAAEKGSIKVVDDQHGSPTYTLDLAKKIAQIIKSDKYGIYHVTNSGNCTWYDFAKEIIELSGIDATVSPCTTEEFPRPAKRPAFSIMENSALNSGGFTPMRFWKEALKDYLAQNSKQ